MAWKLGLFLMCLLLVGCAEEREPVVTKTGPGQYHIDKLAPGESVEIPLDLEIPFDSDTTWTETKVDLYPVVVYTDSGVEYYSYWLHDTLKPNPCPPCPDTVIRDIIFGLPPGRWVKPKIEKYQVGDYVPDPNNHQTRWVLFKCHRDSIPDSVFILKDND